METDVVYQTAGAAEPPLDGSHSGWYLLGCQMTGKGDLSS
jgi:hypothetical protein